MPWVRIDENALNHAKLLALSAFALRLWLEGLAYCQRHLTDGAITNTALKTFRYVQSKHVAELSASVDGMAPLWEPTENGYGVHDYLQWNDSKAHVMVAREKARERIRKLRGKSSNAVGNTSSNGVTAREQSENNSELFSGGVSLSSREEEKKPFSRARGAGAGGGVVGADAPVRHGDCLAHGPICLKPRVALELAPLFKGQSELQTWACAVGERWNLALERGERLYTADGFEFWRTEYKRDFGSKPVLVKADGRTVEDADETSRYLANLRAGR